MVVEGVEEGNFLLFTQNVLKDQIGVLGDEPEVGLVPKSTLPRREGAKR